MLRSPLLASGYPSKDSREIHASPPSGSGGVKPRTMALFGGGREIQGLDGHVAPPKNRRAGRPALEIEPLMALVVVELAAPQRVPEQAEGEFLAHDLAGNQAVEPLLRSIQAIAGNRRLHVMRTMVVDMMHVAREPEREGEVERQGFRRQRAAVDLALEPGDPDVRVLE